jgi:hypothetical protein
VTDVQDVVNVTPNVPLVEFFDLIVNVAELLPDIVVVPGLTVRLLTVEVVTFVIPDEPDNERVTLPVVPPFFLMDKDETLALTEQPPVPLPVIGGAVTVPEVPAQSAELLWTVVPVVTAVL